MSFIPRITCRRCGRQYSGIRSRCPYCGTRRVKASDRSPAPTPGVGQESPAAARAAVNTKWQMIFGAILLVAVILAVIVLVSTSLNGAAKATPTPSPSFSITPQTPPPTPTPSPTPTVTSVTIMYYADAIEDFTISAPGNTLVLSANVFPTEIEAPELKWSSSDEAVATVADDGTVTGVGPGSCTITVECYGITDTTTCRVRG